MAARKSDARKIAEALVGPAPSSKIVLDGLVGQALDALGMARALVVKRSGYLRSALYSLVPYPVEHFGWNPEWGVGTVGVTEHGVMVFDPHAVIAWQGLPLASVLRHECDHLVLRHMKRIGHSAGGVPLRDPGVWNKAADCTINPAIETEEWVENSRVSSTKTRKWQMPDVKYCTPKAFGLPEDKTAEQYYDLLLQKFPEMAGTAGEGEGENSGTPGDGEGSGEIHSPSTGKSSGKGRPGKSPRACGGVAGNPIDKAVEAAADAKHGRTQNELNRMRRSVANEIKKIMSAKGRGSVPGAYAEWIDALETPSTIPWQTVLTTLLRAEVGRLRSGDSDYSLKRPSRRSHIREILRPGLVSPDPEIAFVVDTSGSMSSHDLAECLKEIKAVFRATDIEESWLIDADSDVACAPRRVSVSGLTKVQFSGRGGTDFRPAFDAIAKLRDPKPSLMLYLTDGDGQAPANAPLDMAVIWVLVGHGRRKPALWGQAVWTDPSTADAQEGV